MTGTEPKHRDWVKLWCKEALLGTIREDLTPEERGTWYDFLLLAGNSRIPGVICANQNTALPTKRIAGILNIEETLVKRCIKKFKESERITVDNNGVIYIVNWSRYQYSDYDRQKPYRQHKPILDDGSMPWDERKRRGDLAIKAANEAIEVELDKPVPPDDEDYEPEEED